MANARSDHLRRSTLARVRLVMTHVIRRSSKMASSISKLRMRVCAGSLGARLVMLCLLGVSSACDDCDNSVEREVIAPGGERKAVVYNRGCGATTGNSLQISVVSHQKSVQGKGNVLIVDDT